ncbi:MAG: hypothetical protein O8C66_07810 [Candidatus Methanoperedens sp.]|nr:hypothetical protein [Candidatus Methanoperedens sp.]MCZ7370401.1 hypothetical protein [Candidatus Methanoperedens sp.]
MKRQDVYKLLAALMILIMIIVPVAYVITSPRTEDTQTTNQAVSNKFNPELWTVNQPFYSISDALNLTPPGAESASFADLESMTPMMIQWVRQDLPLIGEVDSLYKSNTTRIYYTNLFDGTNKSFLLLSTIYPEINDFDYIELPNTYPPVLQRQDTSCGGTKLNPIPCINMLGTPIVYAPQGTAVYVYEIINSLNKTANAYDQYAGLLSKVEPASFQTISSNVSFAKQYYMGIKESDGSYERTVAYLNINASTMKKLNQLKINGTQSGFTQYNITSSGNYTIVRIATPNLLKVLSEASY